MVRDPRLHSEICRKQRSRELPMAIRGGLAADRRGLTPANASRSRTRGARIHYLASGSQVGRCRAGLDDTLIFIQPDVL